jgi:GLPGLI family protein
MDQMGQKMYMKGTEEDKKGKTKAAEPKITYSDDKKTIAEYECKKAVIESKDENGNATTATVWYTDKISPVKGGGGSRGAQFKGLKGVPLEFEIPQGPMKIKVSATAVSTASVPDSKFDVSTEGYTEMTDDMLKGMQGQ